MPQVTNVDDFISEPTSNRENFRQRLMKRFSATDWVRVMNVDNETFVWQFMPESKEHIEFTSDPSKMIYRDQPEVWQLASGQSDVIPGANAYVMIEALYKKVSSKKLIMDKGEAKPGEARNFNWTDSGAQEYWINQIYKGKEVPQFSSTPVNTTADDVSKDLGFTDVAKRGRPAKIA